MQPLLKIRRLSALTLAALSLAAGGVVANDAVFPNKPIKIVVGFPAGQGTDTIARAMAPKIQASLGQVLIVDNKAGAGGILGQQAAATAPPDGYTILFTSAGPMGRRSKSSRSGPSRPNSKSCSVKKYSSPRIALVPPSRRRPRR